MADCNPINLACQGRQAIANGIHSGFEEIAEWSSKFAGDLLVDSMLWWLYTPTINPNTEGVRNAQSYLTPVIALILMCSVLAQCIRIVLQRKLQPLLDVGLGVGRYVLVTTMGLMLLAGAVSAGDAFTTWVLDSQKTTVSAALQSVLNITGTNNPMGVLFFSLVLAVLGFVQWVLGFIRQAGIAVLAVMLPLAAAGTVSQWGKEWLTKILPWLIALVAYKPLAAMLYVIGFQFMGSGNSSPSGEVDQDWNVAMVGIMVVFLAIIALPALMKFFSWAGVSMPSGGGGGSALSSLGQMSGGGGGPSPSGAAPRSSGEQQANYVDATGPGSGPSGSGPEGPDSGSENRGPSGSGGPGQGGPSSSPPQASPTGQGKQAAPVGQGQQAAPVGQGQQVASAGQTTGAVGTGVGMGLAATGEAYTQTRDTAADIGGEEPTS
ncbi:hypothetical protein FHX42_005198 [Saccharopolyspora lacisalsi]|uniref:Type IV secretion system protein n=1 Tax=Halosaccharopolyspora lacisalsi TaxID=1000566 RepID=A0A839E946_9PSEU|nr:hypothetical protein [Halosaccharopolyspora lacisalsi]MBA8827791.1 hypothetical protein [Halosaccharopolyspora lacisalsi]